MGPQLTTIRMLTDFSKNPKNLPFGSCSHTRELTGMMKLVAAFCTFSVNMPEKRTFQDLVLYHCMKCWEASAHMDLTKSTIFNHWTTCQVFKLWFLIGYFRGGQSVAPAYHWCSSPKFPIKNDIHAVYMHIRLIHEWCFRSSEKQRLITNRN